MGVYESTYIAGIPRDRSAELKERGSLVTPARQPSRTYINVRTYARNVKIHVPRRCAVASALNLAMGV